MLIDNLLNLKFIIVTGKGGVGKTTISSALALIAAKKNKKTLLSISTYEKKADPLCLRKTITPKIKQLLPNLYGVNVQTIDAAKEFSGIIFKNNIIPNLIFTNKHVHNILNIIPSLKEWAIMGKLTYHLLHNEFDIIILDAPPTGHVQDLLRITSVISESAPVSMMKTIAEEREKLIKDERLTRILILSEPEELSVKETIQLHNFIVEHGLSIAGIIITKIHKKIFTEKEQSILMNSTQDDILFENIIKKRIERQNYEEKNISQLYKLNVPIVTLPYIPNQIWGFKELELYANLLMKL